MTDRIPYLARAVRGRSLCWFRETGEFVSTDYFNVQLAAHSREDLQRIEVVRYMGNEVTLDWKAMVARHAGHQDPLYVWQESGEWLLEVEAFAAPTEESHPEVVVLAAGRPYRVEVKRRVETPDDWGGLKTKVTEADDGWLLDISNSWEAEYVRQSIENGVTQERRLELETGDHTLTVSDRTSEYVGISVSQRIPGGAELEHKHILRGRLDVGGGSK